MILIYRHRHAGFSFMYWTAATSRSFDFIRIFPFIYSFVRETVIIDLSNILPSPLSISFSPQLPINQIILLSLYKFQYWIFDILFKQLEFLSPLGFKFRLQNLKILRDNRHTMWEIVLSSFTVRNSCKILLKLYQTVLNKE